MQFSGDTDLEPSLSNLNLSANSKRDGASWTILSILLPSAFAVAAVLPWFNRFLGLTNLGWHYFYGQQILQGKIPYRDFYVFVPPLLPLKNAMISFLFGNRLIYMEYLAIAELLVLGVALTAWVSRTFPVFESSVAVTVSLAVYIFTFTGEDLSGLHQETVFFPTLAGYFISTAIQEKRTRYVVLAGCSAGLSFLAKQTSGIATLFGLAVLLFVIAAYEEGLKSAVAKLFWYGISALVPISIVLLWLGRHGALQAFLIEVFVKGSSSKGPLADTILRPLTMVWHDPYLRLEAALAFVCVCVLIFLARRVTAGVQPMSKYVFGSFYVAVFAALALSYVLSQRIAISSLPPLLQVLPRDFLLFFGLLGSFALFFRQIVIFLERRSTERDLQLLLLTGFGAGLGYLVACSWVNYPAIAIPSLVATLAYTLTMLSGAFSLRALRTIVLGYCCLAVLQFCMARLQVPFRWGGWKEPQIQSARVELPYQQLRGFLVSPGTAAIVTRITDDITHNSKPGDAVFLYPNIPLFYMLSGRPPATFAYVHYIDVAPDYVDRQDAKTILNNPPAVMVFWEMTEWQLREGEKNFRHGKRSGVRDLAEALDQLRKDYNTIDSFQTATGDRFVVVARKPDMMQSESDAPSSSPR